MRALLKIERFDLVHVNGAADHRLCMLASMGLRGGRPAIVYTQHTSRSGRSLGAALRARLATDRVICVSEHTRRGLMRSHYAGCGLRTVKNGVDVDYFTPATPEEKALSRERWLRPSQAGCLVVGSNAGTAVYKNWPDMLEAVAMLPGALRRRIVVLIAGEPPNEDRLRYVESLGMQDRATFVGLLDDVRPFLAALDLGFVLSSRLETISFACREMMAMGLPVVVSDVGGLPENVEDGVDGWSCRRARRQRCRRCCARRCANPRRLRSWARPRAPGRWPSLDCRVLSRRHRLCTWRRLICRGPAACGPSDGSRWAPPRSGSRTCSSEACLARRHW